MIRKAGLQIGLGEATLWSPTSTQPIATFVIPTTMANSASEAS
jgi:hypothetical protein